MRIEPFYDPNTFTLTYLVADPRTGDAVVIDPVLDLDPASGRVSETSLEPVYAAIDRDGLTLRWVLETHAHADHLSGSQRLKQRYGAPVAIGARISEVQQVFRGVFHLGPGFPTDGSQFDRLLEDGDVLQVGGLDIRTIATPGHTPACASFLVSERGDGSAEADALFTGDALFLPDYGTGRCDFPAGSAAALYHSVHDRLYALPDQTRVFVGHDYQPGGRELRWETTIGQSKRANIQLRDDTDLDAFVALREGRDATLAAPRLLLPSVQVNIAAGQLPTPEDNGTRYLRIPLRA